MSFGLGSLRGTGERAAAGQIDYRLARQHVVNEYRRGRLSRRDICDAHPELLRVGRSLVKSRAALPSSGVALPFSGATECPICEERQLVLVSFAFGERLPASGRVIVTAKELAQLSRRPQASTCYVVEVCPACSWNHLRRSFPLGRRPLSSTR